MSQELPNPSFTQETRFRTQKTTEKRKEKLGNVHTWSRNLKRLAIYIEDGDADHRADGYHLSTLKC